MPPRLQGSAGRPGGFCFGIESVVRHDGLGRPSLSAEFRFFDGFPAFPRQRPDDCRESTLDGADDDALRLFGRRPARRMVAVCRSLVLLADGYGSPAGAAHRRRISRDGDAAPGVGAKGAMLRRGFSEPVRCALRVSLDCRTTGSRPDRSQSLQGQGQLCDQRQTVASGIDRCFFSQGIRNSGVDGRQLRRGVDRPG